MKTKLSLAFWLMWILVIPWAAQAFTLNVVDPGANNAAVTGFKWLVEEDNTNDPAVGFHIDPNTLIGTSDSGGASKQFTDPPLTLSFHRSHAPVVLSGETALTTDSITLPAGKYVISVLPYGITTANQFDMGGTSITVDAAGNLSKIAGLEQATGVTAVTVKVRKNPVETAVISVLVFQDDFPLNNTQEPGEMNLENFTVTIGDQGGPLSQDAYGNPFGTTYNANGSVNNLGTGDFVTDTNGEVLIENIRPGKYAVTVQPPENQNWHQVTTIEGSKTIDAWVRPNEPPFLVEFGPAITHVFYGFVQDIDLLSDTNLFPAGPRTTVSGNVAKSHLTRPPENLSFPGAGPGTSSCLIGLNTLNAPNGVAGQAVYAAPCNSDGTFTIPNVPEGSFQLVIWDDFLDLVISFHTIQVGAAGGTLDLGDVIAPAWFGEQEHHVYFDSNENGIRDPGEPGIPEQNVNLRFRDGTIYQAFPTDVTGFVPFEEIFPFFHWQVAEVDFARFKATGLSVVVDDGGAVDPGPEGEGKRTPQISTGDPANDPSNTNQNLRLELGTVLTEAYQTFAGQNLRFEWGKSLYGPGENGGISGVVFYAVTRAENDPAFGAPEPWEPGIPNVQVNLYQDRCDNASGNFSFTGDGLPDAPSTGPIPSCSVHTPVYADVDNYPQGNFPGPEDVDGGTAGQFDMGDAVEVVYTDSWDANFPTDCRANDAVPGLPDPTDVVVHGVTIEIDQCADALRSFNQVRPGVFDGGYAFSENLATGKYIVEANTPAGYRLMDEAAKNVDFGNIPTPQLLPPSCVGELTAVPQYLTMLTDNSGTLLPGVTGSVDIETPFFGGPARPLCDRKLINMGSGQNAAVDFFLYTDVPKAARAVGLITDDLATEAAPGKPNFTEKFVVGWLPVAIFDYTGTEIQRIYSDEFGAYNFLVPSSYNIDLPTPSGVGPKMHQICLNHPGPIADANNPGQFITDPFFRGVYSTTCYTFNYETGRVTYLDTPVIRNAAFVGPLQTSLDCELPQGTPVIQQVIGTNGPVVVSSSTVTINSAGLVNVPNPAFPGDANNDGLPDDPPTQPRFVTRDQGFGATAGSVTLNGSALTVNSWTDAAISVVAPAGTTTGQLMVTRGDNSIETEVGITLHVGFGGTVHTVAPGASIQAAIDLATPGDIVLLQTGSHTELPIMYKAITLQGEGAGTVLEARHFSANNISPLQQWSNTLDALVLSSDIGFVNADQGITSTLFSDGQGPGVFVAPNAGLFTAGNPLIDGFTIRGADIGGAVYVNGNADGLQISNMRLQSNAGNYGAGVRIGNPVNNNLPASLDPKIQPGDNANPNIRIHHNMVVNGGSIENGGGIAVFDNADNYRIDNNWICGNLSRSDGGGISHLGLSPGGQIDHNTIVSNESFQGIASGGGGGGIAIAGDIDTTGGLTIGSGAVNIDANLIQGNLAGSADGGGITLSRIDGVNVPTNHAIAITNNMIVQNVTGVAGGGIAMRDAEAVSIVHNTVARNDSSATGILTFTQGNRNESTPQPAGIVSRPHSAALRLATGSTFSDATLRANIVWENESYFWCSTPVPVTGACATAQPGLNSVGFDDFGVLDTTGALSPTEGFVSGDLPAFVNPVDNVLESNAAADEAGNFVQVTFTPLGLSGDYHIAATSAAIGQSTNPTAFDIDGDSRANPADAGADEQVGGGVNTPPTVTITAPGGAISVGQGAMVSFTAITSDAQDGNVDATVEWTSSDIGNTIPVGPGTSVVWDTTGVTAGTYLVTVTGTDSGTPALTGSDTVSVTITVGGNTAPTVTALVAIPSTASQGTEVVLTGMASDVEDTLLNGSSLSWTSDLDGPISDADPDTDGGSTVRWDTIGATVGVHTLTASVTDSGGLTGTATVSVTINGGNLPPVVTISSPANGTQIVSGNSVTFTASAIDPESGNVAGSLVWVSSQDGTIGTGPTFATTALSLGSHTVTATASDGTLTGFDVVTATVTSGGADTLICKKATFKGEKDELVAEVISDDFTGTLTMDILIDGVSWPPALPSAGGGKYKGNLTRPIAAAVPTGASVMTATSSLGGTCMSNVKVD